MLKNEKISRRKIKAIETKNKIYDSADHLFKNHGFENVSVDSIVEMAGVSKGSFYVHFDSKNSLIAALFADSVKKVDLEYKSFLESLPSDTQASDLLTLLAGKISDIITCVFGYDRMKVIYEAQITRTINTNALLGFNRDIYKIFGEIINQGIRQGEFKTEINADTIAHHCVMSLRGITYEWCIRYPDFDLKDQALKHFEILLTGIKKQ